MTTVYNYYFEGDDGLLRMTDIMKMFRYGFKSIGDLEVEGVVKHRSCPANNDGPTGSDEPAVYSGFGADKPMKTEDVEYRLAGGAYVIIKPFTSEPKLEVFISVPLGNKGVAKDIETNGALEAEAVCGNQEAETACDKQNATEVFSKQRNPKEIEVRIRKDIESIIYMDHGMGYCCE